MVTTSLPVNLHQFRWNWQEEAFSIVYEVKGNGMAVLLLPAFSTVSSRSEMAKIADLLAPQFQVYTLDWLGFGDSDRPALDYQPAIFQQLLGDFLQNQFETPVIIIAAGHAAGYALQVANQNPNRVAKLVLVAPTWLGPLCAMGIGEEIRQGIREMVRSPLLGEFLYFLNTLPPFLEFMYRRHVYLDPSRLTPEFIEQKHAITQHPNARYAPAAFVTGKLDPVSDRRQFLEYFSFLSVPVLVIIADDAPPKSKSEMESLTNIAEIARVRGTLGVHEENPQGVTEAMLPFLTNS